MAARMREVKNVVHADDEVHVMSVVRLDEKQSRP
jgi:hypothetical protein